MNRTSRSRRIQIEAFIAVGLFAIAFPPIDEARACSLASGPRPGVLPANSTTLDARAVVFTSAPLLHADQE